MSDDYLWDRSGKPDPEVARLEQALSPLRHRGEWREPPRRLFRRPAFVAASALALAAAVAIAIGTIDWRSPPAGPQASGSSSAPVGASLNVAVAPPRASQGETPPGPPPLDLCVPAEQGFRFEASMGAFCEGVFTHAGSLPVGTWLETPYGSAVDLRVADIGAISVRGGSKVRIVETGPNRHRLELVRGSLHAKVNAPPRLFVIDTRAASAIDLGCAYDLGVDDEGRTHLAVTSGVVSLEGSGRAAHVPRGARVTADPARGPGTVLAESASLALRTAADRLDAGDAAALAAVLKNTSRSDAVTLWNLLAVASGTSRGAVLSRIDELGLRPAPVTHDALLAARPEAVESLRERLEDEGWLMDGRSVTW